MSERIEGWIDRGCTVAYSEARGDIGVNSRASNCAGRAPRDTIYRREVVSEARAARRAKSDERARELDLAAQSYNH